jgi:hypothetical protein
MYAFGQRAELIRAGYEAAVSQMDNLRALFPPGTLPVLRPRRSIRELNRDLAGVEVKGVRVEGRRGSYVWVPKSELRLKSGDPFTLEALGRGLRRLYNTNRYLSVWPWLAPADSGRVGITLEVEERPPTCVSVGVLYDNSRKANASIEFERDNLLRSGESLHGALFVGNYRDGGEAGVRTGRLQRVPLSLDLLARSTRTRYVEPDGGDFLRRIEGFDVTSFLGGSGAGMLLAGGRLYRDEGDRANSVAGWSAWNRVLFGGLVFDNTDDWDLPREGRRMQALYELHLEEKDPGPAESYEVHLSSSHSAGPFSFTPAAGVAGVTEGGGGSPGQGVPPFRLWHRWDLTRSTLGRFEPAIYSPHAAGAGITVGLHVASNLSLWMRGGYVLRGERWGDIRKARASRGLESGLLQETPIGPILLGSAWEPGRRAFLFIQVGNGLVEE